MKIKLALVVSGICIMGLLLLLFLVRKRQVIALQQAGGTGSGETLLHRATQPPPTFTAQPFDWRLVESTNYHSYILNLRNIGCPERTIRDIVIADVNALFDSKEKAMPPLTNRIVFWKYSVDPKTMVKSALISRHEQLEGERTAILKQLLGDDVDIGARPIKISDSEIFASLLDFVPPEEQSNALAVVNGINSEFAVKFRPLLDSGEWNQRSREDYGRFWQETQQKLLRTLGPEGKENYELRTSSLASQLRSRFQGQGFDLSEAEFVELFRYAQQYALSLDLWYLNPADEKSVESNRAAQRAVWEKANQLIGQSRLSSKVTPPELRALGVP